MKFNFEIEKKFEIDLKIFSELTVKELFAKFFLEQQYLSPRIRIKSVTAAATQETKYFLTIKNPTDSKYIRAEFEEEITREEYLRIFRPAGNIINKTRYIFSKEDCPKGVKEIALNNVYIPGKHLHIGLLEIELEEGCSALDPGKFIPETVKPYLLKFADYSDYELAATSIMENFTAMKKLAEDSKYFKSGRFKNCPSIFIETYQEMLSSLDLTPKYLTINGVAFARTFNRVVIGGHGPYVEFETEQFNFTPIIQKNTEWRSDPKYNCKYLWYVHPVFTDIKIYGQTKPVDYADYIPGKFYVELLLFDQFKL